MKKDHTMSVSAYDAVPSMFDAWIASIRREALEEAAEIALAYALAYGETPVGDAAVDIAVQIREATTAKH